MQHLRSITLKSYAKINWYLRVFNRRSDGYHNIESLMQKITLHDDIIIEKVSDLSILIQTEMDIPVHENLVYKAALRLMEHSGVREGARIKLKKNIPSGAGLGGGSSDAAYTLMGLNELWNLCLSKEELLKVASTIGSDVPFFLTSASAIVRGRGEIITEAPLKAGLPLLIVKPEASISTKEAYESLNRGAESDLSSGLSCFIEALQRGDYKEMSLLGINDFENAVFSKYPEVAKIKKDLQSMGALYSLMSGSGSALYGIFNSIEDAEKAAESFKGFFCCVTETL